MKTNIMQLAGSAMLAVLLTACGGGGGGGTGTSPGGTAQSATTPQQMSAVVDQSNNFTSALCPNTVNGSTTGTSIDPSACLSEAQSSGTPNLTGVVASFCPTAATSFTISNVFDPAAFTAAFSNPQGFLTNGPLTFPVACLQEAATNMGQISSLIGADNPLTQTLCPTAATANTFDPATCFSEIASGASAGGLPGLPGLPGSGSIAGTGFLNQFCPQAAAQGTSAQTPMACLNESSRVYITVVDMLTAENPLYDALCPQQAARGRVQDPVGCFQEALGGGLPGGIPGLGNLPGLPGGGGGVPGLSNLTDQLSAICPNTIAAGVSPTTPIDCLTEAGQNLGGLESLLGGLGGGNPLTNALCPSAAAASSFDPTACFTEALGKLPSAGGGVPQIPGVGMALNQICPTAAAGNIGPTTPIDCLMELGGNFGNLQDVLGNLGGANPLTNALCPTAAASGSLDPAACFTEALQSLPGGLPIPGSGNGGGSGLPGFGSLPLVSQLCPNTAAGAIGVTTPVDCLSEAGGNLGQIQNLLGGLGGANPLTNALCPNASNGGQLDPAACLTEALGQLGNLPGAGGGGQQIPGLSTLLAPICPTAAASGVGPTTAIACLTEAGGKLGQLQSLLGGLASGSNPLTNNPLTNALCPNAGGDPQACLTEALAMLGNPPGAGGVGGATIPGLNQLCPNAAAAGVSPTTPIACLTELGGNLGQLQGLLSGLAAGGSNPLTDALCPNAGGDPQACLTDALGQLGNLPGAGGTGGVTIPGLDQICPNAAANIGLTTPVDCLTELGGNLGQLQSLLGGLASAGGGGNPLSSLCPNAGGNPQACLTEALGGLGGLQGLGQLQNLLGGLTGGSNPLTQQLCPIAATAGTLDPVACLQESLGTVSGGGGAGIPVLGGLLAQVGNLLGGILPGLGG